MIHARRDYQGRIVDTRMPSDGGIPEDEPVLFIRGQDICAVPALDAWVAAASAVGASGDIVLTILEHRERIIAWQAAGHVKVPDFPTTP